MTEPVGQEPDAAGPGLPYPPDGAGSEPGASRPQGEAQFYRGVLDHLHDGVYFVDRRRRITYWNHGAERITGYSAQEMVGSRCADGLLMHVDDAGRQLCGGLCPLLATMRDGSAHEAHVFLHHADGHRLPVEVRAAPMYDETGTIVGAVESFSDNSALIAALNRITELDDAAVRDPLTGVGNRRYADVQVRAALVQARAHAQLTGPEGGRMRTGVLFVDLDRFKNVNDRHGHLVGDQVLAMVARTMTANLRTSDVVARWGGEEFLAIISNLDGDRLLAIAEQVRMLVANAALVLEGGDAVEVTVSIGATLIRPGDTVESLTGRVDQLMYSSKQQGRNRVSCDQVPAAPLSAAAAEPAETAEQAAPAPPAGAVVPPSAIAALPVQGGPRPRAGRHRA